jgi:hypothetical protein
MTMIFLVKLYCFLAVLYKGADAPDGYDRSMSGTSKGEAYESRSEKTNWTIA